MQSKTNTFTNSVDPDKTARDESSDQDLHSFFIPLLI